MIGVSCVISVPYGTVTIIESFLILTETSEVVNEELSDFKSEKEVMYFELSWSKVV